MRVARYEVVSPPLISGADLLERLHEGVTELEGGEFEGAIGLFLHVPVERAEIVEAAAKREGIVLEHVGDEDIDVLGEDE